LLLVNYRYDPATPLSSAVGTARALADTRLITIEGCGHRFFNAAPAPAPRSTK
jgi:pimeloyl-ACP methyl ester carboxylesterase